MALTSKRCCGDSRTQGAIYLEVLRSPKGLPLEHFLWCQPQVVDPATLGISPVGVHCLPDKQAVYHVFDWVGEKHYADIWDFLMEGQFLNFSRKIPKTFDFSNLTSDSRVFFIHRRAWIDNWKDYFRQEPEGLADSARTLRAASSTAQFTGFDCPRETNKHRIPFAYRENSVSEGEMCSRIWRQDLTKAVKEEGRWATRTLPCGGQYQGLLRPEGVTPRYKPAIFASFPIGRLAVIKGSGAKEAAKRARRSSLEVVEVEV